ncbi:MAG TPA: hypothetical protein VH740_23875 [Vicinamibacterales bacterium]
MTRTLVAAFVLLGASWAGASSAFVAGQSSAATKPCPSSSPPYGYVIQIPAGTKWEIDRTREPISVGMVLCTGDLIRIPSPSAGSTPELQVMLYATGAVSPLRAGQTVPTGEVPRDSWWTRLSNVVAQRLTNDRFVDGAVRSGALLRDAALSSPGPYEWRSLIATLDPGTYRARFRRMGPDAAPIGEWTSAITVTAAAGRFDPPTFGSSLTPGLWQITIRHESNPSISGDAWILITTDAAVVQRFADLAARLDASGRAGGPDVAEAVVRVRRAALLSLAS